MSAKVLFARSPTTVTLHIIFNGYVVSYIEFKFLGFKFRRDPAHSGWCGRRLQILTDKQQKLEDIIEENQYLQEQ